MHVRENFMDLFILIGFLLLIWLTFGPKCMVIPSAREMIQGEEMPGYVTVTVVACLSSQSPLCSQAWAGTDSTASVGHLSAVQHTEVLAHRQENTHLDDDVQWLGQLIKSDHGPAMT